MYTACTLQMGIAMQFGFMKLIPDVFFPVSLAAWLATFLGLLGRVLRNIRVAQ